MKGDVVVVGGGGGVGGSLVKPSSSSDNHHGESPFSNSDSVGSYTVDKPSDFTSPYPIPQLYSR